LPHARSLYATAYRMMRNAHDAEDLVQETLLRAYRGFDRYTPGTNIRAWLYTILHRVRTDAFRRMGRALHTVELDDDGPGVPPSANHGAKRAGSSPQTCAGSVPRLKHFAWSSASSKATNGAAPRPHKTSAARPAASGKAQRSRRGRDRRIAWRNACSKPARGSGAGSARRRARASRSNASCSRQLGHSVRCASTSARAASSSTPST